MSRHHVISVIYASNSMRYSFSYQALALGCPWGGESSFISSSFIKGSGFMQSQLPMSSLVHMMANTQSCLEVLLGFPARFLSVTHCSDWCLCDSGVQFIPFPSCKFSSILKPPVLALWSTSRYLQQEGFYVRWACHVDRNHNSLQPIILHLIPSLQGQRPCLIHSGVFHIVVPYENHESDLLKFIIHDPNTLRRIHFRLYLVLSLS